ncbi:MAG TPA: hypothetical protein VEJ36_04730 [Nitrososphaerales archaeon]|nr:hypothetical protein [Nitrososphaerales archaeon]
MPLMDIVRKNTAYLFLLAGAVWAGAIVLTGSVLVAWPTIACLASGVLLLVRPEYRITYAWVISSAVLGLLLAGWQAVSDVPFLSGDFALVAAASLVAFLAFALLHAVLLYGYGLPPKNTE